MPPKRGRAAQVRAPRDVWGVHLVPICTCMGVGSSAQRATVRVTGVRRQAPDTKISMLGENENGDAGRDLGVTRPHAIEHRPELRLTSSRRTICGCGWSPKDIANE